MFILKNKDFKNYEDDRKDERGKRKKMILNHRQWTKIENDDDDDDGPQSLDSQTMDSQTLDYDRR